MSKKTTIESPHSFSDKNVAVLVAGSTSGELGGAERLYQGLVDGLRKIGCIVEVISVPADESTFENIVKNYAYCNALDLSKYDIVISTKTPTYAVIHPCHIMYLIHTVRVFDDMFYENFPNANLEHYSQRSKLHILDTKAITGVKAKFAIGHEVANRLYRWRGIRPEVIHPPLGLDGFRCDGQSDYFFLPGRLHVWKRVDLIINAIKLSTKPLKLIITGTGEAENDLKELAGSDQRIKFLGRVSDEKLVELYANSLAVPFVPKREDYGYITLEAFASSKPVVTCCDSGEPTYFVKHRKNGLVCQPSPDSLCKALEWIYEHRDEAQSMGEEGKARVSSMSWTAVATQLVQAAIETTNENPIPNTNIAVIDMQPITPAIGGSRLRLLGLYHNLGEDINCHYVGSYDWPGESYRKHQLTNSLEEVVVPLSDEHHAAAQSLSKDANGKTVIDIAFSQLGHLSTSYLEAAKDAIQIADVVVFSHPWVYPLLADSLTQTQTVIYDSQNVEGYLRAQLLDDKNATEAELLKNVIKDEYNLGRRADLILACSQEDMCRFNRVYEFPFDKIRVAPNGVMAFEGEVPDQKAKIKAKSTLQLDENRLIAIFIGSPYGPNLDAAKFIAQELSKAMPEVIFVIAGGVGTHIASKRDNVIITGAIDEQEKHQWLCAADIAVNPMFSGSGTNIKMFDFMALKLPTVTTAIGARGIETGTEKAILVCDAVATSFVIAIRQLQDVKLRNSIGESARICVEDGYSWERISFQTGTILKQRHKLAGQPTLLFSVVIPTYERHDQLEDLMRCLQGQLERDFEVIIVDQSSKQWIGSEQEFGFPVLYYHSPVKGAVRARNTGAALAQGEVLAFTDDDCRPDKFWLINARKYFLDKTVVGVEGSIVSDHPDDDDWRQVTNIGFEGIGFMTANLLVRSGTFQQLGGFDLQFDKPHFREDTDLGWRMLEVGDVPYANDVSIFHPAQSRKNERESATTRARFFEKDPLLLAKHPKMYEVLFQKECHWKNTLGFWDNFERGAIKYNVDISSYLGFKNK